MTRFLVNRPIAVIMSFVLIILLGIVASLKIPISLLPDSSIPKIEIIIDNPGDSPEDFDTEVVQRIRNNLLQINNIIDINSYSNYSKSKIELVFDYGSDLNLVFFEVNEKIDETLTQISYNINRPKVLKSNLSDIPSLYLSVSLKKYDSQSFMELSSFIEEKLKSRLEQTKEISFVDITGLTKNIIQISFEENLINSLGITLSEIKNVLKNNNFSFGNIEISQGYFTYDLSIENKINTIYDIENTILSINNKLIKLSDVASVESKVVSTGEYFYNLNKSISLAIIKNPSYRESDFVQSLDDIIKDIQKQYPEISISKTKDQTTLLKETISGLSTSLFLGVLFAVLITFIFLKSLKNVLLIVITVTASLFIDFFLFYVLNISINLISISGLILGIGLMIDNIIIVLDNIEQKIYFTKNIKEGSILGVNEIIISLISSALTTCSIFIPLIFLSGLAGILFYDQAISVTITLVSSFIVSIILLPTLFVLLNKKLKNKNSKNGLFLVYERIYKKIYANKIITSLTIFVIIILGLISFIIIEKEQLPKLSSSEIVFKIKWDKNYSNEDLNRKSTEVIGLVKEHIISSEFYINQQNFLSKTQRNAIEDYETYFILKLKEGQDKSSIEKKLFSNIKTIDNNIDGRVPLLKIKTV